MACFIISYDLTEGADYDGLAEAIKAYGTWAHITQSTWAVVTSDSAKDVRDYLLQFMPEGSRLFVARSGHQSAWVNVICRSAWLKEHV
jgi:hypothetical protein